jgi:hypothetical protein
MMRPPLVIPPLPPPVALEVPGPQTSRSPEWHDLRLFGHGRHGSQFASGRERIGDL